MAIDGADGASDRLSGLTGVDTDVGCTRLHVVSAEEVTREFERDETLAITISLEGFLEGEAVTVFDKGSAGELAESFMPMLPEDGYTPKHEAAVEEICNVMVSGYVDGWANVHDESIVMSPPTVVSSALPDEDGTDFAPVDGANHVVSQRSSISTPDEDVGFQMYLFLDEHSGESLLGTDAEEGAITDDSLDLLQAIAREGTASISDRLAATDSHIEATVDSLEIVPAERLSAETADTAGVATVVELLDPPSGCVLVLFDEDSASTVADLIEPSSIDSVAAESPVETDSDTDASVESLGALVATSLVDGVADATGREIETAAPAVVHDMRSSIVTDAVVNLDPRDRFVVTLGATLESAETELDCDIYTLLTPDELSREWSQE
ncbi:chemotaxis protein CheC [Natronolimnohabitans innermongolicus JCM 12255]|uniref:Chemotaxis protein CheC n=2 Tax=Natronolimnohabitans innermongolicus TaxID=253107 RepID=L9WI57_9EURY|nr:chemotaxis protein CheC [Natronolimnohabitans innermongolicus JCM 12255]